MTDVAAVSSLPRPGNAVGSLVLPRCRLTHADGVSPVRLGIRTEVTVIPSAATRGQVVHADANGSLTLYGVTRTVTIFLDARPSGIQVPTVAWITFPFTKFGLQPPNIVGLVSVENHATMESDLRLQRGASARDAAAVRTMGALRLIAGGSSARSGPAGGGAPGPTPTMSKLVTPCLSKHGVSLPSAHGGAPSGNPLSAADSANVPAVFNACNANARSGRACHVRLPRSLRKCFLRTVSDLVQ